MTTSEYFAKRLRKARKEKGFTQAQLGERLGITGSAISDWESTNSSPSLDRIEELGKILDRSPSWFFLRPGETAEGVGEEFLKVYSGLYKLEAFVEDTTEHLHTVHETVLGFLAATKEAAMGAMTEKVDGDLFYHKLSPRIGEERKESWRDFQSSAAEMLKEDGPFLLETIAKGLFLQHLMGRGVGRRV